MSLVLNACSEVLNIWWTCYQLCNIEIQQFLQQFMHIAQEMSGNAFFSCVFSRVMYLYLLVLKQIFK